MLRTASLIIGGTIVATAVLAASTDDLTPQLSTAFQEKMQVGMKNGATDKPAAKTTPFEELELNSYLRFGVTDLLPVGLTEPFIKLMGQGRANLRGVVDLDVVRQSQ